MSYPDLASGNRLSPSVINAMKCPVLRGYPAQAITFRTLLLLLYSTGVRIGEALALTLADVDLGDSLLMVRDSKFFKTRVVPTGPKLTAQLETYAQQRRRLPCPDGEGSAFFATRTGRPLVYTRVNRVFQQVRTWAGIQRQDGARDHPRLMICATPPL